MPPQDSTVQENVRRGSQSVNPEDAPAATESNEQHAAPRGQDDDAQPQVNRSTTTSTLGHYLSFFFYQDPSTEDRRPSESREDEDSKAIVPSGQEGEGMVPTEDATENDPNQDDAADEQSAQANMGPMNGNFMNFGGGDMNQMQMMMAMQNGMNPAAFGSFPMMGMFFFHSCRFTYESAR